MYKGFIITFVLGGLLCCGVRASVPDTVRATSIDSVNLLRLSTESVLTSSVAPLQLKTINKPLKFTWQQTIAPAALTVGGLLSYAGNPSLNDEAEKFRNRHFSSFNTKADNFLVAAPYAVVFALDAFGVQARNDFSNQLAIMVKSEIVQLAIVNMFKYSIKTTRPDRSNTHSFPSGHTAHAFAGAAILSQEFKDQLPWMPYAAYSFASVMGGMRILNNKHYLSDVLIGAAIGFLSVKLSYWLHQYKWGARHKSRQTAWFNDYNLFDLSCY